MPSLKKAIVSGIPVVWAEPESAGPAHLVIWLSGFSGSKESVTENLLDLARGGFVGLSFDAYQHGERSVETRQALIERIQSNIRRHFWPILAQTAEETPFVVDWALQNLDLLPDVCMGGISMGGDISVAAAAVDHRIKRVAAVIATPDWLRPGSFEPPGHPDEFAQECYDRRNPLTHLADYGHRPAISFQCGADDRQVPPDGALRFVTALQSTYAGETEGLNVVLHSGVGHAFIPAMWRSSLEWFSTDAHEPRPAARPFVDLTH